MGSKYPEEFITTKHYHLYRVWMSMIRRCEDHPDREDSRRYFGKGITVCESWKHWPNFAKWMLDNGWKRGLTIDRINNELGYYDENCRIATFKDQHHNRDLQLTYQKIKEGQTRRWQKPFMCVETGEVFKTQIEAFRKHNVDRKSLRYALNGRYSHAGGLRWRYVEASP
jgi:hypothetical protein